MKCHDGKEQTKSGCSVDAFRGLYASGCIDLAIMARLVAPEQGYCENGEGPGGSQICCQLDDCGFCGGVGCA